MMKGLLWGVLLVSILKLSAQTGTFYFYPIDNQSSGSIESYLNTSDLFGGSNQQCVSATFDATVNNGIFATTTGFSSSPGWTNSGESLSMYLGADFSSQSNGSLVYTMTFDTPIPPSFTLYDVSASVCGDGKEYIDRIEVIGYDAGGNPVYPTITINCPDITVTGPNSNIVTGAHTCASNQNGVSVSFGSNITSFELIYTSDSGDSPGQTCGSPMVPGGFDTDEQYFILSPINSNYDCSNPPTCTNPVISTNDLDICGGTVDISSALTAPGGTVVTYHGSQADADAGSNPVGNTQGQGIYFVRVEDGSDPTCYSTDQIIVNDLSVDASFVFPSTVCLLAANPVPTSVTENGGVFTVDNSGTIDASTGALDITGAIDGDVFVITYTLDNGTCADVTTQSITINDCSTCTPPVISTGDLDICGGTTDISVALTAPGGTVVTYYGSQADADIGSNPVGNTQGQGTYFVRVEDGSDPSCYSTDQIIVNDLSVDASFVFPSTVCLLAANPVPTSVTENGGVFTVDNSGSINGTSGELDITASNDGDSFTITYTLDNGTCNDATTQSITVNDCSTCTPPVISTGDLDICGGTVDVTTGLTAPVGTNVTVHSSQADADAGTNPLGNGQAAGTYFVRVEDGVDPTCFSTDQIVVSDLSVDASFAFPLTACLLDPNPSPSSVTTNGGVFTVNNAGTVDAGSGTLDITSAIDGDVYTITYTVDNGTCSDVQTQNISIIDCSVCTPPSILSINANETFCGQGSLTLSSSVSAGTVSWVDDMGNVYSEGDLVTPTVTTTYTVSVDDNGCVSTASFTIVVNPIPAAPVLGGNNSICDTDSLLVSSGDVNTQWYLDTLVTTPLASGASYTLQNPISGTVYANTVDPVTGCESPYSSFTYTVLQGGFIDVPDTLYLCEGSPYTITANASDTVDWGNGTRSYEYSGIATNDTILTPSVVAPCGTQYETIVLIVNPNPTVEAGPNQEIVRGELVNVAGSGAVTYEWELINNTAGVDYLNCSTCQETEGYILFTSLYVLYGWNEYGCVDTDTLLITIDGMINAYVPNIFSPNGDGENDVFRVEGPDFHNFSMLIFNRWGELIYETSDNTAGWDGTWRNQNAGTGVFTYVIEGRAVTGEDISFGGNVTLVR